MTARHVARALARRDFRRYFSNPTGYVFITLFIFLSAAGAFWRPRFFQNNLANLDELNEVFPYLLVFFVAALTLDVWSEERKEGTDELLLTLPASDVELVLGKYAAVLGIYTVALLLSVSHAAVLVWLGRPDPGLLAANYLGYWLAGAALIPVGMLASALTSHATVAFVLAAVFCGGPVLLDAAVATFSESIGRRVAPLGLAFHFSDFARGVLSLTAVSYFVCLGALFLYVNVVVIGRRHWVQQIDRVPMVVHHVARSVALAVALVAVNAIIARAHVRLDVTAEQLHSLGGETRRLIASLPPGPVTIHAFVSPEVPAEYVQERENLLSTLREIRSLAGNTIDVLVQDTEPYSPAAHTARERFGIVPRLVSDPANGTSDTQDVFLGAAFTSGPDEQVIPFFEHGLSAEYEVTRAIRVVARAARKRIGVVDTDANVFGGADFESGRMRLPWAIVGELRKQYDVVHIAPWSPIQEQVDALLVVLPSTLLQRELDVVFEAIKRGTPALLIVDPLPAFDMRLAPAAAMAARMNPYAPAGQALTRKNVGDIQKAMSEIGVAWPPARVAWDSYRPRAESGQLPPEVLFIGPGNGNPHAFHPAHAATTGVQELVMMYAGYLAPASESRVRFEPLVQTGRLSGSASYFQLVQPTPAGPVLNVKLPHQSEGQVLTLAAHIRSDPLNVVVIADLDFISDQVFDMRASAPSSADNITFFLNCVDVLAKDESFIALRKRRVRHRTLERVEAQTRTFMERRNREEQEAAAEAQSALESAQSGLNTMVAAIEKREDLDAQSKAIMARNVQETERRRLEVLRRNIEQAKNLKIQASREAMGASARRIQSTIRTTAAVLPLLPMLLMGTIIFARRRRRERSSASGKRVRD
jgi:ABC-2 type transport system permease protein